MIRNNYQILLFCFLVSLVISQNMTCYSNCRQGYCSEINPRTCTACDRGQVNINGRCISSNTQPYPLTYLTINDQNQLQGQTLQSKLFGCTVYNTSFFNQRQLSTLLYETVPGTTFSKLFYIQQKHAYIKFKFNAAIVQSTTVILEYELLGGDGTVLLTKREPSVSSSDPTLSIQCLNTTVQGVFYVQNAISSSQTNLTLQIRSLDSNAVFGVSNIEVYYGSCHQKCSTCSGPTQSDCITCQGLYMRNVNGVCQVCLGGYYDAGNECRECPQHCKECQYNATTQLLLCTSCLPYATFSSGACLTQSSFYALPQQLTYPSSYEWFSSELSTSPVTLCGRYSLIGGVSIGRQGSFLAKTFKNLPVHSQVEIYFTFWMIDQQRDDSNSYQVYVDGVKVKEEVVNITAQQQNWNLSNECGNSNPELVVRVQISAIPHQGRNLTVSITSFKNWFGVRDFTLVINNKTNVVGCFEQQNGKCQSCLNGFKYDPATNLCNKCSDGYYLKNGQQCEICPIQCKTCGYDKVYNELRCLSCFSPLQLVNWQCKDMGNSIYSREIVPATVSKQNNFWTLYPKLPQKGITTCGGQTILGSDQIRYKFLTMSRSYQNLPQHRGVKVYFHFYQIDLPTAYNQSIYFVLNGKRYPYTPTKERKEICGDPLALDAIVKVELVDQTHTESSVTFEMHVDGKVKVGINNVILFLLECQGCDNQVGFKVESIPVYSLATPPQKGLQVKLLFPEPMYNSTPFNQALHFSINDPQATPTPQQQTQKKLNQTRKLQGLVQFNKNLPVEWEEIVRNREYRAFLPLTQDYIQDELITDPFNYWKVSSGLQGDRVKLISPSQVTQHMPRYIEIDENNIDNRKNIRNLRNLFQGCAIFALWIGLGSFIFGFSPAFDDFFILVQVIFAHIFIQLAYSPPSFRVPLQGMQIVQFMAWLPWQARQGIQKGIIASQLYQHSPIQFQQYYKDIVFARTIYHTILFLIFMCVLFILLKIFSHIVSSSSKKQKYVDSYIVKYYNDYQNFRFAYLDKFVRFAYFTVVWACALQFIELTNQPREFSIWNSVLCIVMFVLFVGYPIAGFIYLKWRSGYQSQGTFQKNFEDVRIDRGRLWHFIWRYYRLLVIALLIALVYKGNPLAILIPLIIVHIVDGLIIVGFKPFGLYQEPQLNVCFYNSYPQVYQVTSALQSFLFAFLELFILIMYAVRDKASNYSYLGLGYFCCAIVVALLANGLVRLVWGFIKIVEACFSRSKEMKLQVQNKAIKEKEPNQEAMPMKSIRELQSNVNTMQSRSRMNTMRKQSYVSKIN